nr:hypothetical protein [Tanacetum cinerariifolium]
FHLFADVAKYGRTNNRLEERSGDRKPNEDSLRDVGFGWNLILRITWKASRIQSDHVDSFEEDEIIGDSVLNNDGCVKDYMEKNLDDDLEKDIEDCSKNVTEKCGMNTSIPEVVEDLSSLDRSSDKAEGLAQHNNGLYDLDNSLHNRLLHQDKCRVRPVKAAINDSSIVSPSTPPGTVLNLVEESCSTWLDYVGPLITDELDSKKH